MGGCFSSRSTLTSKNSIRLVHLSGYVEDIYQPVSVSEVTRNSKNHFVCTSLQLLSSCSKPLKGDSQLQPGNLYFILPYSILQADVSPVDLASLVKRLTTIGKTTTTRSDQDKNKSLKGSSSLVNQHGLSNCWDSSPSKSPCRVRVSEKISVTNGGRSTSRLRPWKPILDTIREKSFNRRSESDLQSFKIARAESTLTEA